MLNAERYMLVKEIFLAASSRSPDERLSFLDEACGADLELRTEVESLLSHDDSAEEFMKTPLFKSPPQLKTADIFGTRRLDFNAAKISARARPTRIDSYAIIDVLGEGGMGVVYLAQQDNPKRRVALKVIRPGLSSREMLRRFEFEAQLLGRLQHPGIAQIFQAGVFDDGDGLRPYYAMELIEGQPLGAFIDEHNLDIRQRLELLIKVCEAVHHAHQKGIIHRDLKPGNILVSAEGTEARSHEGTKRFGETTSTLSLRATMPSCFPKILDFGVACAVGADDRNTIQTGAGQLIGTISYMSPEQVAGNPDDLDTRSDVYALGVIGFEMLARALPHDFGRKPIAECARVIRDEEPRKLSAFDKTFRGDLETIFAKALEKDQSRRYQSASDLAADLGRFLTHEPISARRATMWYRLHKRFERNPKTAFTTTALGVLAVIAIVVGTWVWWAKGASEQYASGNRAAFSTIKDSYYLALQTGDFNRHRTEALQGMLAKMDSLAADTERRSPRAAVELYVEVAEGYRRLGMFGQQQTAAEHALALQQQLSRGRDAKLADALHELGRALWWNADYLAAEQRYTESLDIRRRLFGERSAPVAQSMMHLAACVLRLGRMSEAEALFRQVLDIRQGLPNTPNRDLIIGETLNNLAVALHTEGRFQEALGLYEQSMKLTGDPENDKERRPRALCTKAEILIDLGRFDEASRILDEAQSLQGNRLNQALTARMLHQQARLDFKRGHMEQASELLRQALLIYDDLLLPEHLAAADSRLLLGRVLLATGDNNEAIESITQGLAVRQQRLPADHWLIADAQSTLGEALTAQGRFNEAEPYLIEAHERLAATRLPGDPYLMDSIARLVQLYERSNREDEAQHWKSMIQ